MRQKHFKYKYFKMRKTKNKIDKHKISFLLIIILSFFIIRTYYSQNFIVEEKDEDEDDYYKPDNNSIYCEEKFESYTEAFDKAKDFINNNLKGILLNTQKIKLSTKPKVSIVMPCYNCTKYILKAIRSIQNQDLSNFEIIIVNDASTDDSLKYIEQLQKEESRIEIVKNIKNMGILYSRAIGTLSAKGKYIFPMDQDDMVLDKDVFSILINIANKGKFDIIIFNTIRSTLKPDVYTAGIEQVYYDRNHKSNLVLFQPDLGNYLITPTHDLEGVHFNDELIHGKLFRTKIYKKALNKLGKERYSRYMTLLEDDLGINIIFNTAKSGKFIAKYGYLWIESNERTAKRFLAQDKSARRFLYLFDALIDFSLDLPNNKKVLVGYVLSLFKHKYFKELLNTEYDNKLFVSCLDRLFNCKYISDVYKNEIRKRGKNLTFIKYNF